MVPPVSSRGDRARSALILVGGLLVTVAVVVGVVALWPDDDDDELVDSTATTSEIDRTTTSTTGSGEPSEQTSTTPVPSTPVQLFVSGADAALADMAAAAGDPGEAIEIAVYPTYAFLAYRSPSTPSHIDRRSWREGEDQDDAAPNPIDDRVDADTQPQLFPLATVDLTILPAVIADAEERFDLPVAATHVLIDRFLPFDDRVLIRVYASPSDGRSGGGYVQYTLDGSYVKTVG
jgi:hypothetical protein